MLRSSLLTSLNDDYVRTARAKGLTEREVVIRHALRNAMIPTVTVIGLTTASLLAGAVLTETIFSWPGIGKWMIDAIGECAEHGRKHGIIVGVQNHGDMLKSAPECIKVLKAVNSEWCGLIADTGNMLTADPYADIAAVVPYAVNWQLKESIRGNDPTQPADVPRICRLIREGGYRGYVPIETLVYKDVPYDPLVVVPAFARQVQAALNAV
jgi:sugar phosphate isomerase/epimerase